MFMPSGPHVIPLSDDLISFIHTGRIYASSLRHTHLFTKSLSTLIHLLTPFAA